MRISEERADGVLVLRVGESRIDAACAPAFRDMLAAWIGRQATRVVIDLSVVTIMDSTGLGALVAAVKVADSARLVAVAGASNAVATLFKLTRMDKVFQMFPTVAEAAAAVRQPA
jgi:anti-sigma B factor antagonist